MLSSEAPARLAEEPRFLSFSVFRTARRPLPPFFRLASPVLQKPSLPRLSFLLPAASLVLLLPLPVRAQPAPVPPTTTTTIERIVAVVDGRPLLLSDLRAMERVRGLTEPAALEALIDERLMYLEASRLPQAEVLPEEEQRATAELVERRPELRDAVPAPDLRRLVSQQAAILKYVEFRFRPQLRVSDQEVRSAFEADPSAGDSWEAAKELVRARLERQALDERVEAWVRELRGRAELRYVERPASPAAP